MRIGAVHVDGLGRIDITDAAIARGATFAKGSAMTAPHATARVNLLSLLLRKGKNPVEAISRITLNRPTLAVQRSADGRWDFQDVIDRLKAKSTPGQALHARVTVAGARFTYVDDRGFGATPQPIHHEIANVQASVTPRWNGAYAFNVSGEDTNSRIGALRLAGNYSSRSGAVHVTVNASRVAAREIENFLPKKLPLTFESGAAALRLTALFHTMPNPRLARQLSPSELTAEVQLNGIGIRLDELTAPIIATSGKLRLVNDPERYPKGSKVELLDVRAHADNLPLRINGSIGEIDLFDLQHLHPVYDLHLSAETRDGDILQDLFAKDAWPRDVVLHGASSLDARLQGHGVKTRLTGIVSGQQINFADVQGENAEMRLQLLPLAPKGVAPVRGSLHVGRATIKGAEFSDLSASLTSATPWNELDNWPVVTGEISAGRVSHPWATVEQLRGQYTADRDALRISGLHADVMHGQIAGEVTIPFTSAEQAQHGVVSASGKFTGVDLRELGKALHFDLRAGTGDGSITLSTAQDGHITISGKLDARDAQYRNYAVTRLVTDFAVTQGEQGAWNVNLPSIQVASNYGVFHISDGTYTWTNGNATSGTLRLPVTGEQLSLRKVSGTDITGTAKLTGTIGGTIASPQLEAHVTARDVAYLGHAFQTAESDVTWMAGSTRLRNLVVANPGMTAQVMGKDGADIDPSAGVTGIFRAARTKWCRLSTICWR